MNFNDWRVGIAAAVLVPVLGACGGAGNDASNKSAAGVSGTPPTNQTNTIEGAGRRGEHEEHNQSATTLELSRTLLEALNERAATSPEALTLPLLNELEKIPQDPSNPLTIEKILLGQRLFHETGLGLSGNHPERAGTYSCASCHQASAGFKAGIPQGIGEGGDGFGEFGEGRVLATEMDGHLTGLNETRADFQPVASPTILNTAYQDVMLWNGQFGNSEDSVNQDIDEDRLLTPGTPKQTNARGLSGLETQAVAGLGVHRLSVGPESPLQTNPSYIALFEAAYPDGSDDILEDAAKAIAAYERIVLASEAPFQRWLRGDIFAMSDEALRGGNLFFGKAGCAACHQGAALSSAPGASANEIFFAVGFGDFDLADPQIHGEVSDADKRGRGGFTGEPEDDYKFKLPGLYNLTDASVLGHGASFKSVREVIEYKNAAVPQQPAATANLDPRFRPLGLSDAEIDALDSFLSEGLVDENLARYEPDALPTGQCFPVADAQARHDLGCD
ncbi:MAG: cytochrome-c peroxidase [Burkholderiaceae bacterium]